jgi:two-component system capsular synthesis sensor histidine kinase RcsC
MSEEESDLHDRNCADCRFLRNLGHDLRTPLNGIIGNLDLLETACLPGESQQWLQAAVNSAGILEKMLIGMLTEAKSGDQFLQEGDWEALLQSIVDMQMPVARKKGIGLEAHYAPEIRGIFIFNETRWRRIAGNLLANAIKFTARGGVTLNAFAENTAAPGACDVCLVVKDTGCGIPAGEVPQIFNPFYRGRQPEGMQQHGQGLGLSIVKNILDVMGGEIVVETNVDLGSNFLVRARLQKPSMAG